MKSGSYLYISPKNMLIIASVAMVAIIGVVFGIAFIERSSVRGQKEAEAIATRHHNLKLRIMSQNPTAEVMVVETITSTTSNIVSSAVSVQSAGRPNPPGKFGVVTNN